MPCIRLKGVVDRVYVPGIQAGAAEEKKHP